MRWRLLAAVALAIAGGLASAGPAHAQYFGQNKVQYRIYDWRSIQSDHFEVYFYTGLDSLAMRVLDLAEKTNVLLSARMGHQLTRRVPIILYGSHNDFAQTNLTPEIIEQNTGGFTEALRNRVVLPFTGSYEDLRHVVVHELVHAFMFDLLYGSSAASLIARQSFFSVPLWFGEGLAEHYSLGMESNAEMFLRDGTIDGYLPPLMYSGGFFVYKQGQSAIGYFIDRYGEERLRDLLLKIRQSRSFDRAFLRSTGISVEKFDEQWRHWVRKRYWPTVATKEDPEEFSRRLTDHRNDESHLNTAPAISPHGDRIAFFSDRQQYTDVFIMSAYDGKVQQKVIRGERNNAFESIPSFRSSITWSPDGTMLALTAKTGGRDCIYILKAKDGKVLQRIDVGCDALAFPAWSPVSDSLVVTGLKDGRSDLWLIDIGTSLVTKLTDDTYDEKEPTWSPDGQFITFSSDRMTPVVLHPLRRERGYGAYAIYSLEIETGFVTRVLNTWGDDRSPAWSADGRRLAFISDRGGTSNIFLYDLDRESFIQLTDVIGGVSSLSWSRHGDRLTFSAFTRGGYDVFTVKEPLSSEPVLEGLRAEKPGAVFTIAEALEPAPDSVTAAPVQGALARAWPDSLTEVAPGARDTTAVAAAETGVDGTNGEPSDAVADTTVFERPMPEPVAWERGMERPFPPAVPDTASPLASTIALEDDGGPFAVPDSVLAQEPSPYRPRLAPEYAGGGFAAATGYGFAGSTQFVFGDFLGNHSLYVASDVFSSSLEETNALVIYNYLPRRWDFGAGVFHFKNYFSSSVTTLGTPLGGPRLFSERTFGALVSASYPMDRFRRIEFNLTQMFVERTFFEEDPFGQFFEVGEEFQSVVSPAVSLIGDHALMGYYGPVNGARWNLTYSPSIRMFSNGLEYHTVTLDTRRYMDFTHGYTFASRFLGGFSNGQNAQTFRIGGFNTLRGYSDFDIHGSRILVVNTELRFPFIQQLGIVGPVPLGIFNMRGAVFADAGVAWYPEDQLRLTHVVNGERRLYSPRVGFGTGIRTATWLGVMKLDCAWSTSGADVSRPRWHFSFGYDF